MKKLNNTSWLTLRASMYTNWASHARIRSCGCFSTTIATRTICKPTSGGINRKPKAKRKMKQKSLTGLRRPRTMSVEGPVFFYKGVYISIRFLKGVYIAKFPKRVQPIIRLQCSSPSSFLFYNPVAFHFHTPSPLLSFSHSPSFSWPKRET